MRTKLFCCDGLDQSVCLLLYCGQLCYVCVYVEELRFSVLLHSKRIKQLRFYCYIVYIELHSCCFIIVRYSVTQVTDAETVIIVLIQKFY